ncbi:MAG: hypothetical protein R6X33_05550 [Candidatus Brocadiia bacterium]
MAQASYSVRDFLRMLFRRKWYLLLPICGSVVVAALLLGPFRGVFPPTYTATAYVIRRDSALLRSAPRGSVAPDLPAVDVNFFRAEILTWPLLDTVMKRTKLDVGLDTPREKENMREKLRKSIDIRLAARPGGGQEQLIAISVTDRDPERAKNVANAVANTYKDSSLSRKKGHVDNAMAFFSKQEQEYRQNLRDVEVELAKYRQEHYEELPEVRTGIQNRLLQLRIERSSLQRQLEEGKESLAEIEQQLEELPETIEGESTSERNPVYAELEERIRQHERALRGLLTRYTKEHPDVKKLEDDIAALEEQLAETPERLDGAVREVANPVRQERLTERLSIKQRIRSHQAALTAVEAQIEAAQKELRKVAEEENRYNELLRQRQEYATLYAEWRNSNKRQQTSLEATSEEYGREVEVHAEAIAPTIPDGINTWKLLIVCIGGGVAAGTALMFGREYTDYSFRDREDAKVYLDVPVLGSIMVIETPGKAVARRRRRLALAAGLGGVIMVAIVAVFLWEQFRPGAPEDFLQRTQTVLSQLVRRLQG